MTVSEEDQIGLQVVVEWEELQLVLLSPDDVRGRGGDEDEDDLLRVPELCVVEVQDSRDHVLVRLGDVWRIFLQSS